MTQIAYVNGQFLLNSEAGINIEDRGLQFGDAVYEVWAFKNKKLMDEEGHFARLQRSLNELRINYQVNPNSMKLIIRELMNKNRLKDGIIYLQISRGTASRDHAFPKDTIPNIIFTAKAKDFVKLEAKATKGLKICFKKDNRWGRVDIKTTNLLPNVLAKQEALENGFDDLWFYDADNYITEGSAQNAWIINNDGELITRPLSQNILSGITRSTVMKIAKTHGFKVIERNFTIEEAINAKEAFVTSATSFVTPIIKIEQNLIGDGRMGKIAATLRSEYFRNNM